MDLLFRIFFLIAVIPSAIIHEVAHGFMADMLGDPTAKYAGRLTLDPRVHIDKWGTIILPLFLLFATGGNFMFAYAKPVPFNPYNLRNQKYGPGMVGAAGPVANLALAFAFTIFNAFLPLTSATKIALASGMFGQFGAGAGLDGSTFFIRLFSLTTIIILANIGLAIFNLTPIPPLDGSKVLFAFLPDSMAGVRVFMERNSLILIILFLAFGTGVLSAPMSFVYGLFASIYAFF